MFPCDKPKLFDQTNKTNKLWLTVHMLLVLFVWSTLYDLLQGNIGNIEVGLFSQKSYLKNTSTFRACDFGGHRVHISFPSLQKKSNPI